MLDNPYDSIIKILENRANEIDISKEMIKEIYDMERGQTHLNSRGNEVELRQKLLSHLEK